MQATFIHVIRCSFEVVSACSGEPGGLRDVDLDALAEAAWETFVGEMREACVGGLVVKEDHP